MGELMPADNSQIVLNRAEIRLRTGRQMMQWLGATTASKESATGDYLGAAASPLHAAIPLDSNLTHNLRLSKTLTDDP